jgi:hypothetical protein
MQNSTAAAPHTRISSRAIAVVRGLRCAARSPQSVGAMSLVDDDRWVTIERTAGGYFFISIDGAELRRGPDLAGSDVIQNGFTNAMVRLGGDKTVAPAES